MSEKKSRPTFGRMLGAFGRAICYLLLFLGWQTVASMACTYAAMYEMGAEDILAGGYRDGMLGAMAAAVVFGAVISLAVALILKKRGTLRAFLGVKDTAGKGRAVLTALAVLLFTLAVFALLGRMGWQMLVGLMYLAATVLDGGFPDVMAVYDAVLGKIGEISAVSGVLTLASAALLFKLRKKQPTREVWLFPTRGKILAWGAGLAFCLYWAVTVVLSFLPASWMEGYMEASAGLEQMSLLMFLSTGIIAPIVEEVIFRGLVYTRLQRVVHPLAAVIGSALLFGYCHGELVWFCYAFILGVIFAQVTRRTGSILPAVVMHLVFNCTNELMVLLLGDWGPGVVGWLVILAVAAGGGTLCTNRLRAALEEGEAFPLPIPAAEEAPAAPAVSSSEGLAEPARPGRAMWDEDSGAHHRFPPERR